MTSLDLDFPSNEAIMEAMDLVDRPWDDMHHHTSFLPYLEQLEDDIKNPAAPDNVQWYQSLILTHMYFQKGIFSTFQKQ
jgi:hypothetical protein